MQVESVALTTNIGATLAYIVFFLLFLDFLNNRGENYKLARRIFLPFVFLIPMLLNEYLIVLPFILFVYSFFENYKKSDRDILWNVSTETIPYLTGFLIYIGYFIFSNHGFFQQTLPDPARLFLERIFWLTPQIIFHFIKLIFYPKTLSIDQSGHVLLGSYLFDPYSIFCILFLFLLLFIPTIVFLISKKWYIFTLTIWLFFISILPFSQALSPTYCLAAERYLYIPLFIIVFGIAQVINHVQKDAINRVSIPIIIFLFLITTLGIRTYVRTLDWKDNYTLLTSTIKRSPNTLYKGFRYNDLANLAEDKNLKEKYLKLAKKYYFKAINELKEAKDKNKDEPIILKSYGLDNNTLLIKAIHLVNFIDFKQNEENYKLCLERFKPYLKYFDNFEPWVLELYANLLIKKGDLEKGKEVFLYTHKKFPTSPFILISLIRFERDIEKNLDTAKVYVEKARKLYPYSKDILFEAMRHYNQANNLPEYTKHAYLYGLRAHSKFAYHEALTGFLILEDLPKAKKTIDKLIAMDEKDPKTYYLASSYYIKGGNLNKAKDFLNNSHSLIKEAYSTDLQLAFDVSNTLATIHLKEGNVPLAIEYAKEAFKLASGNQNNVLKVKELLKNIGIDEV